MRSLHSSTPWLFCLTLALGASSCRDSSGPPSPPLLEAKSAVTQTADAGSVVASPTVRVGRADGSAIAKAVVVFSISGSGTITVFTDTTDASGLANAGTWRLANTAATSTVTATSTSVPGSSVVFTATGRVGAPASLSKSAYERFVQPPYELASPVPSVIVRDAAGNPVPGVSVTFSVGLGGGTATGIQQTTNTNGVATLGSWRLGDAGDNSIIASVSGLAPVSFNVVATHFDIELRYRTVPTTRQRLAFERALLKWSRVITGDLPAVMLDNLAASSSGCYPALNETIDDLVIYVDVSPIDGAGGVLGQAGPCLIRSNSRLSIVGRMTFDEADLATLENNNTLDDVIVHEMGHVLGIGTLWSQFEGLLVGVGTSDPYFTGVNTRNAFASAGGSSFIGNTVPVENTGGTGTRDSHWRETVLRTELMTGFISGPVNPMSAISIASLQDIGYAVNAGSSDAYTLPGTLSIFGALRADAVLVEELLTDPDVVGPNGRIVPRERR